MQTSLKGKYKRRKKVLLKNNIFTAIGYLVPIIFTIIAKIFNFISTTVVDLCIIFSIVYIAIFSFRIIILFKKKISHRFASMMHISQFIFWLFIFSFWTYHISEIRILSLIVIIIPLLFLTVQSNLTQALLISVPSLIVFFLTAYFGIKYKGQPGSIEKIIIYTISMLPPILFISYMSENFNRKKQKLINTKYDIQMRSSEIQKINQKLTEVDRIKTDFFTRISHELRTPLTLILSPIESVIQKQYSINPTRDFFVNIQRNAIKLLKIINNLLDFSKVEAGRMYLKIVESDIVIFIKNYFNNVQSAAESRGIFLNFSSTVDELLLHFDKEKMDKIFMNVFSFVLSVTAKEGYINILISENDKFCIFEIENTSSTLDKEKIESIVSNFNSTKKESKLDIDVSEIGLSLSREFIHMLGGQLFVKSKCNDEVNHTINSICFQILFVKGKEHFGKREDVEFVNKVVYDNRIKKDRMPDVYISKEENYKQDNIIKDNTIRPIQKILIINDNTDMTNFLFLILKDQYNLYSASSGNEGLEYAKKYLPNLIITDSIMPDMNGFELAEKIKSYGPAQKIPILMLMARSDSELSENVSNDYVDDYLQKPFNTRELMARIKILLKLFKLSEELNEVRKSQMIGGENE